MHQACGQVGEVAAAACRPQGVVAAGEGRLWGALVAWAELGEAAWVLLEDWMAGRAERPCTMTSNRLFQQCQA